MNHNHKKTHDEHQFLVRGSSAWGVLACSALARNALPSIRASAWAWALALIAVLALSACTVGSTSVRGNTQQQAIGDQQNTALELVDDIPIPSGAILDTSRSLVLGRGSVWTGKLVLRLSLSPVETFSLYQNEMPSFGWQPILSVQEGIGQQVYIREQYATEIIIEPLGVTGSRVTITKQIRLPDIPQAPIS